MYDWSPEKGAALRSQLGLNDPFHIQYGRFLWNAIHGDLGRSYLFHYEVFPEVVRAYTFSMQLGLTAFVIAVLIGVPLGILSVVYRQTFFDALVRTIIIGFAAIPTFIVGLLLVYIFSVRLQILASSGAGDITHLILPATTLATFAITGILRMTRATMLEVITQDYVRTAISKGLRSSRIMIKHVLRNALIPIITLLGLYMAVMIGAAVITEYVFAWPGIGTLTIKAIQMRDVPMIQAGVLALTGTYIFVNIIVDIIYASLDPRLSVR